MKSFWRCYSRFTMTSLKTESRPLWLNHNRTILKPHLNTPSKKKMGLSYNVISIPKTAQSKTQKSLQTGPSASARARAAPRGQPAPRQRRAREAGTARHGAAAGRAAKVRSLLSCHGTPERCAIGKHLKYVLQFCSR